MADVLPVDGKGADRLAPGTRLGRYELLLPVARGGMARVWAARQHGQRGFSKIVAVKTILPHLRKDPQFERMFVNEARVASFIQHPNVCQTVELGEDGDILYMAMEWVSGDSFARVLKGTGKVVVPVEPRIVARILADACAGLHAAHVQTDEVGRPLNIVHRDVSPHNIMLTADGNVKVCDFGVAKALGSLQDATLAGQIKGKINYMPPEQFMGAQLDGRSDVFAMGIVLYEATTGKQPFDGDNDLIVMQKLARGDFVPPTRFVGGYPMELEHIIMRAMQPEPHNRFASAEQMRIALEEWIARSGPIVTQTNVAHLTRERIGNIIDARRDQIMQASQGSAREPAWQEVAGHTPSNGANYGGDPAGAQQPGAPGGGSKSGVMSRNAPSLKETMPIQQDGIRNPMTGAPVPQWAPPPGMQGGPMHAPMQGGPMQGAPMHSPLQGGPMQPGHIPGQSNVMSPAQSPSQISSPAYPQNAGMPPMGPMTGMTPMPRPGPNGFSMPPSSAPRSVPAPPMQAATPESSGTSYYAGAIAIGVVLAVLIGGIAFFAWSRVQKPARTDPVVIVSVPSTAGGEPSAAVAPTTTTTAPTTTATTSAAPIPTMDLTGTSPSTPSTSTTPPIPTTEATALPTTPPPSTAPANTTTTSNTTSSGTSNTSSNSSTTTTATATSRPKPDAPKPTKPAALPDNPY
jgi:serine/threonine-protein kinase